MFPVLRILCPDPPSPAIPVSKKTLPVVPETVVPLDICIDPVI